MSFILSVHEVSNILNIFFDGKLPLQSLTTSLFAVHHNFLRDSILVAALILELLLVYYKFLSNVTYKTKECNVNFYFIVHGITRHMLYDFYFVLREHKNSFSYLKSSDYNVRHLN